MARSKHKPHDRTGIIPEPAFVAGSPAITQAADALKPFAEAWKRYDPLMAYSTAPYLFVQRTDFRRAAEALHALAEMEDDR